MIPVIPVIYTLGGMFILNSLVSKVLPEYIKYCDHDKDRKLEKFKFDAPKTDKEHYTPFKRKS